MSAEFELEAGSHGPGELHVLAWQAEEHLSRPFELELEVAAGPDVDVDAHALVGQDAVLTIRLDEVETRCFAGIVARIGAWDAGGTEGRKRFRVTVVPRLHRLSLVRRSRIFQGQSVPEIVGRLLKAGGVEFRASLSGSYGKRDYCVQYRESDLDFVHRLLEEEGIFYFFEHEAGQHTLVLGDATSVHVDLPAGVARLPFRAPGGDQVHDGDAIESLSLGLELRPGAVALTDYAFKNPALDLFAREIADGGDEALELYDFPGEYQTPELGKSLARVRLEEQRCEAETARGTSRCRRLMAGYVFELDEHPLDAFNRRYLLRSVKHVGRQPEAIGHDRLPERTERYRADFVCQPADVVFRPARVTARPLVAGAQTAVVVGPPGEEIFPDEHGRVKVQFHWDREGQRNDRSSCWIRVAQAWAGPGWGALYLPRVGQEVLVEFLEGDPDRPLVTGRVYNGHNPPPVPLPGEKTRSTLRSSSSPGDGGHNELAFEDAAGRELVYLHAQKDLEIAVENDKHQSVGGHETLSVGKDRQKDVKGHQSLHVGKDDQSSIDGNQSLAVGGNRVVSVGGNHGETIGGTQSIAVDGAHSLSVGLASVEVVGLAKSLSVGGAYAVTVGAAMIEAVAGMRSEVVGASKSENVVGKKSEKIVKGSRSLSVGGSMSEDVGKDKKLTVKKNMTVKVGETLGVQAGKALALKAKEIVLTGEEELQIKVGDVTVTFKKNGDAVVKAKKLEMVASGDVVIKGAKISEN